MIDILETRFVDRDRLLEPQHVVLPTELIVRESCGQKEHFRAHRTFVAGQAA